MNYQDPEAEFYRFWISMDQQVIDDCIRLVRSEKRWRFWVFVAHILYFVVLLGGWNFYHFHYWMATANTLTCMLCVSLDWPKYERRIQLLREVKKVAAKHKLSKEAKLAHRLRILEQGFE